jgi:hypothetical protein
MTDTIKVDDFHKIIKRLSLKVDAGSILVGVGPEISYIVYLDEDQFKGVIDNQNKVDIFCGPLFRNTISCKAEFR